MIVEDLLEGEQVVVVVVSASKQMADLWKKINEEDGERVIVR